MGCAQECFLTTLIIHLLNEATCVCLAILVVHLLDEATSVLQVCCFSFWTLLGNLQEYLLI